MSDFDRLKKYSVPKADIPAPKKQSEPESKENIFRTEGYYIGKITSLERDIKDLREDVASLFTMLMDYDYSTILTKEEAYDLYMKFKMDRRHIINRKEKLNV